MELKRMFSLNIFLLTLFLIGFSSAATCSSQSDIMIRLSANTNAHAAIYTDNSYTSNDVCYSAVFGSAYTGSSPQTCTGYNTIVKLSSTANAHAEIATNTNYPTSVCYGDLSCTVESGTGACSNTAAKVVLRLSSNTNAHTEHPSANTYTTKICCLPSGSPVWKTTSGAIIPNGGSVRVNTPVDAYVPNYNGGPDNTFDIEENDPVFNDVAQNSPFTGGPSVTANDFYYRWTPTTQDTTNSHDSGSDDGPYQWFFRINNKISPYLNIRHCGDGIIDDEPGTTNDEMCDWGVGDGGYDNGDTIAPIYGLSNGQTCSSGELPTGCQLTTIPFPYCGDGVNDGSPNEECDWGANNGQQQCDPVTGLCQTCDDNCDLIDYSVGDLIWTDTSGNPIAEAEVDDTVLLVYPGVGTGYAGSTFSIYEKDIGFDDTIKDITNGQLKVNGANTDYVGSWKIKLSDLSNTNDYDNFGFSIDGNSINHPDNELKILMTSSDDPLDASITNLVCGDELVLGSGTNPAGTYALDIMYDVWDTDDLVSYVLKINGIAVAGDTDGTLDSWDFGGSFQLDDYALDTSLAGTVNVRLEAINSRGEQVTDVVNLILIDPTVTASYVAACIDSPENYERILTPFARFDASGSKKITYTPGTGSVAEPIDNIEFEWSFSDGYDNPYQTPDERAYSFDRYFNPGINSAQLTIR